jgi:hypothetical protein
MRRRQQQRIKTITIVPALIDPPGAYVPLSEWLAYRAELDRRGLTNSWAGYESI